MSCLENLPVYMAEAGLSALSESQLGSFEAYLELILRWNGRTNLTAIRDEEGILRRHFVESIACAAAIPAGVVSVLDLGSGAGFPGIPIAICRPEVHVTLAESQGKKAAFLAEAVRTLGLTAKVHAARAENLTQSYDCVTMRAVDRMDAAITTGAALVRAGGYLAPMTTRQDAQMVHLAAGEGFCWQEPVAVAGSTEKIVILGIKIA